MQLSSYQNSKEEILALVAWDGVSYVYLWYQIA